VKEEKTALQRGGFDRKMSQQEEGFLINRLRKALSTSGDSEINEEGPRDEYIEENYDHDDPALEDEEGVLEEKQPMDQDEDEGEEEEKDDDEDESEDEEEEKDDEDDEGKQAVAEKPKPGPFGFNVQEAASQFAQNNPFPTFNNVVNNFSPQPATLFTNSFQPLASQLSEIVEDEDESGMTDYDEVAYNIG